MIQIDPKHLKIIQEVLIKYPLEFYVFGSRSKGFARKYSDLDLCVKEYVSIFLLEQIKLEFSDTDLPYTVDIICLAHVDENFKQRILNDLIKL